MKIGTQKYHPVLRTTISFKKFPSTQILRNLVLSTKSYARFNFTIFEALQGLQNSLKTVNLPNYNISRSLFCATFRATHVLGQSFEAQSTGSDCLPARSPRARPVLTVSRQIIKLCNCETGWQSERTSRKWEPGPHTQPWGGEPTCIPDPLLAHGCQRFQPCGYRVQYKYQYLYATNNLPLVILHNDFEDEWEFTFHTR